MCAANAGAGGGLDSQPPKKNPPCGADAGVGSGWAGPKKSPGAGPPQKKHRHRPAMQKQVMDVMLDRQWGRGPEKNDLGDRRVKKRTGQVRKKKAWSAKTKRDSEALTRSDELPKKTGQFYSFHLCRLPTRHQIPVR
jgi:hypothetical protein